MTRVWIFPVFALIVIFKFSSGNLQKIEELHCQDSLLYPFVFNDHAPRGKNNFSFMTSLKIMRFSSLFIKIIDRRGSFRKQQTHQIFILVSTPAVRRQRVMFACSIIKPASLLNVSHLLGVYP